MMSDEDDPLFGSASPSSCLETTELTVEKLGPDWLENNRDLKDRLWKRLMKEGREDLAVILDGCDQEIMLRCSECQTRLRGRTHCKKRWCPICAVSIAASRVEKFTAAVLKLRWPMHITLTISNEHDVSKESLRRVLHAFRKLRQRLAWSKTVRGGFASLEITNRGRGWHPHLHIIADCEWFGLTTAPPPSWWSRERKHAVYVAASTELGHEWSQVVKQDSASVRIRRKYGGEAGARSLAVETMKYTVKATDLVTCGGSAAAVIDAMTKVRLFRGFGSCFKLKLDEQVKEPCPCAECGALRSVMPESVVESRELRAHKNTKRKRRR